MYDAIVIGARCAGAITAMLLARQGHRVLLLDRGFDPERRATRALHTQAGATTTRRMGSFGESSHHELSADHHAPHRLRRFPLVGRDVRVGNLAWGHGPRRRQLDQVLVEAAIEVGVEFRPNFLVENLVWNGDRVQGIRGRQRHQNASGIEQAYITIGADVKNSALARAVGAPHYEETPALTCWYFSYWSGVPTEGFEMYAGTGARSSVSRPTTIYSRSLSPGTSKNFIR